MKLLTILRRTFKEWMDKDPFRESAVIAYYAIFSLPGLFVIIISVAGLFLDRDSINQHVLEQVSSALDEDTAKQIENIIIRQEGEALKPSVWGAIIGIVTLLLGATGVFIQFQKSLNNIWGAPPGSSGSGVWQLIKIRLFSFGLILSIAFLLIVSLLITTLISVFSDWLVNKFSASLLVLLRVVNFLVSLGILTVLFALMLKILPDVKIKWRDVWVGSVVTALLFILGRFGLSLYFGKVNPDSVFGVAGSVILILLWVSYSSMIIFFGAEFTHQYALVYSGESGHAVNAGNGDSERG